MSLEVDLAPLWASIQDNFPIFFSVLVVPAGILVAIRLANFLINKVTQAFK